MPQSSAALRAKKARLALEKAARSARRPILPTPLVVRGDGFALVAPALPAPPVVHESPIRVRWARRPFHTPQGACVALMLRDGRLLVLVGKEGTQDWRPVAGVLSPEEARWWAKTGF